MWEIVAGVGPSEEVPKLSSPNTLLCESCSQNLQEYAGLSQQSYHRQWRGKIIWKEDDDPNGRMWAVTDNLRVDHKCSIYLRVISLWISGVRNYDTIYIQMITHVSVFAITTFHSLCPQIYIDLGKLQWIQNWILHFIYSNFCWVQVQKWTRNHCIINFTN